MTESPTLSFASIAIDFQSQDPRYTQTLFELHATDLSHQDAYLARLAAMRGRWPSGHPTKIVVACTKGAIGSWSASNPTGPMSGLTQIIQREIPDAKYFIIASPVVNDNDGLNDEIAKSAIHLIRGALTCLLGRGALMSPVATLVFSGRGSQVWQSAPWRSPSQTDYHQFSATEAFAELVIEVDGADAFVRDSIWEVFSLFGRAAIEYDLTHRFTLCWIGLERAANGIGDSIAAKLGNVYGRNKNFVFDTLDFTTLKHARRDIIHHGKRPDLPAGWERKMQAMALDLCRHRLKLPCAHFAASLVG